LTKLAKIVDLKVISRTSVMDYRGKRNVRQIGNELRASHVLEGSVRRAGTQLRLNAQLIDTPFLPNHSTRARVAAVVEAVDASLTLRASEMVIIGR
jgi:hypothetical protein